MANDIAPTTTAPAAPQSNPGQPAPASDRTSKVGYEVPKAPAGQAQAKQVGADAYELVINGKRERVTLDELKAHYSKERAADEKFKEASSERKKAEELWKALKDGDFDALERSGLTPEEIRAKIEKYYRQKFIDPETLSPEEKRARDAEKKVEEFEKREKERREKEQADEDAKLDAHSRKELQSEIISTLEKSGLPKTRFNASRIAYWTAHNLQKGWDAPQDVIVSQVKKEQNAIVRSLVDKFDADTLVDVFGEEVVNKVRAYDLKKFKERRGGGAAPSGEQPRPRPKSEPKERTTMTEVTRRLNEMRRQKS